MGGSDTPVKIPDAAPGQSQTAPRPIKENVVAYHTGDERMHAARQKARDTIPRFMALMKAKTEATHTVKFPLTQNGATEHIWLQVAAYKDGKFIGLLSNEPVNGATYKIGDRMDVAASDVEDWMVVDGQDIYGGYSTRLILDDMPPENAAPLKKRFRD